MDRQLFPGNHVTHNQKPERNIVATRPHYYGILFVVLVIVLFVVVGPLGILVGQTNRRPRAWPFG
jgi:hypothetical protein